MTEIKKKKLFPNSIHTPLLWLIRVSYAGLQNVFITLNNSKSIKDNETETIKDDN